MLVNQTAVVTGGSRGVGRAVCLALASAGANLVVGYHTDAPAARNVCDEAIRSQVQAVAMQVDVGRSEDVYRFMKEANAALGPVDILVNCAGTWPEARIWDMEDQQWHEALAVNLHGTYYTCQAASKGMMQRGGGKIVNFSSIAAVRGARSGHAHYAAAKGGVLSFTRSLANELGPYNINVNAVAPGMIRTNMTQQALAERAADYHAQVPLGRIGLPEDVAGVVLFLVSPAARYITGQTIHVNGGMWMS
jgi:3-oxoacyl-[acyl-carrier protein] reductase